MQSKNSNTILFAQVNNFSYTNDAISASIQEFIGGRTLEQFRVFPAIKNNPIYFLWCWLAVLVAHGPKTAFDKKRLTEKIIKTPTFFRLATAMIARHVRRAGPYGAILQTQGLFNAKIAGIPLIVYTDNTMLNSIAGHVGDGVRNSPIVALETRLYKDADVLAVTAGHVAVSLRQDYGIDADRIQLVYIGANAPKPTGADSARFAQQRILFVGIDWDRKGGPELIEAYTSIAGRFPRSRLTIVGCNPPVSHPNIIVMGRVPPEKVTQLMCESAIFCLPSRVEPSSVAVIEASRAGLPIVGTAAGGFLDSVRDGQTGLLVPIGDVKALAAALSRLLADPALCETLGQGAAVLSRQFDWRLVCQKLAALMPEPAPGSV